MPVYINTTSISIYPGEVAFPIGVPPLPASIFAAANPVGETVVEDYTSIAVSIPANTPTAVSDHTIQFAIHYDTAPSGITAQLQGAIQNIDSQFTEITDTTSITDVTLETSVTNFRFFRIYISALTGTCVMSVVVSCL